MTRRQAAVVGILGGALAIGMCMVVLPVPGHLVAWSVPVLALLGALATAAASAIAWQARRHGRLAHELQRRARPVELAGVEVQHLEGLDTALVAGLRRPRIYCGRDVADRLTPRELRAVLLHERHHQLDRAPAKLVVLEAVAPLLRIVEGGRAWLARRYAALEIAADRYALEHGVSRASLAGALVKLAPARQTFGVGFASAAELRLKALLDGDPPARSVTPAAWLAAVGATAAVCVMLLRVA